MPESRALLALSTAHVSGDTARMLNETHHDGWPVSGGPTSYGWFIYAHDDCYEEMPYDLVSTFVFARKNGFEYIMFDCDVEPITELPQYDW
jgi:hypothetical protein